MFVVWGAVLTTSVSVPHNLHHWKQAFINVVFRQSNVNPMGSPVGETIGSALVVAPGMMVCIADPSYSLVKTVSLPADDVDCARLRRILFLLATYFSLVVVLSVDQSATEDEIKQMIVKMRGSDKTIIPEEVLPSHRIVAAQSRTGRIALVRQLGNVEFVLDHEQEMKNELERFGFKVFIYGSTTRQAGTSRLAAQLTF